jgi:hypothetical protein
MICMPVSLLVGCATHAVGAHGINGPFAGGFSAVAFDWIVFLFDGHAGGSLDSSLRDLSRASGVKRYLITLVQKPNRFGTFSQTRINSRP